MNKNLLYFTDDCIYLYNSKKNKIYRNVIPKGIIIHGRIANINKFIGKFETILKDNNLNNGLFGEKIKIIVHSKYTSADITLLKNIFEKLNYRNIKIDNEIKYYKLNEKNAWINRNKSYMLLSYIDEYKKIVTYLLEEGLFFSEDDMYKYIKKRIGEKDLFLIGNTKKVEAMYNIFEKKYRNKTYTFSDCELFIINSVIGL